MMMMMPTKIFSKMYFVWTREILIGQQARTRIRRAFGDDDDGGNEIIEMSSSSSPLPIFFFYGCEVQRRVKARGVWGSFNDDDDERVCALCLSTLLLSTLCWSFFLFLKP